MPESMNAVVDAAAMVAVWLSGITILSLAARWVNNIGGDRRGLWSHVERNCLVALMVGAFCIVLAPLYGWVWAFYGGCIVTVTVAGFLVAHWWLVELPAAKLAREAAGQFDESDVVAMWEQVKRNRALIQAALAYGEALRSDMESSQPAANSGGRNSVAGSLT